MLCLLVQGRRLLLQSGNLTGDMLLRHLQATRLLLPHKGLSVSSSAVQRARCLVYGSRAFAGVVCIWPKAPEGGDEQGFWAEVCEPCVQQPLLSLGNTFCLHLQARSPQLETACSQL